MAPMDQTTAASVELIKARKEYREADEALARATSQLNIAQRRVNELFHARTLAAGPPAGKEE